MKPAPVQNSSFVATLRSSFCPLLSNSFKRNEDAGKMMSLLLCALLSFYFSWSQSSETVVPADSINSDITVEPPAGGAEAKQALTLKQIQQRQVAVSGINIGVYGGSLFILHRAWYKDEAKTSFQVFNDSKEWLQVDKVGHAWTAYNTGRASTLLWEWAGMPHKKAVWFGGLSGFVYLTGIEFLDAYSAKWGWSWGDIAANITGSGLFMGQEFLWNEQRIYFKFSFHKKTYSEPMLEERANDLYGESFYERMLKDYNAQTYWFSANIRSFFPKSNWPAWLNIAVGYGADGMFGGFENVWQAPDDSPITRYDISRKRQYYLAPDIDFTKIKTKSKFLKTTFTLLNAFKCPAPALMMDSKGKFKAYAFYF